MSTFNVKKSMLVAGLSATLSLPLLDGSFSARCNVAAGDAAVVAVTNPGLPAMSVADDLQGGWRIFEWKVWSYAGQAVDVAADVVQGWELGQKLLDIIRVGDEVVVGLDVTDQQEQKVLIQELD